MQSSKIIVGITHGDPNGIGYETIYKVFSDSRMADMCTAVIYGNRGAAEFYKKRLKGCEKINLNFIDSPEKARAKRINFISVGEAYTPRPGEVDPQAGVLAIEALSRATEDAKAGLVHVLVTSPIDKRNTGEGFGFVGHTEYLAQQFGVEHPLMFMISDSVRVGLVTMHIALDRVAQNITQESISSHLALMKRSLERDFVIRSPRIGVLGLNPHSGDQGLIGSQETTTVVPSIEDAQQLGIGAYGPFAADGYFGSGNYTHFDATLAMYHDQGLAPFKALTFESGVNFTAGLPVVRTSPAHGVGFDIAGRGLACESSLRCAIYSALDIYRNRLFFDEISSNPLKSFSRSSGARRERDNDANVEDLLAAHGVE
ncbi:MAG: 4-hydroxythreonine-4-phosphate dehydrogenase PdxA [Rikenellaceae bacterium]